LGQQFVSQPRLQQPDGQVPTRLDRTRGGAERLSPARARAAAAGLFGSLTIGTETSVRSSGPSTAQSYAGLKPNLGGCRDYGIAPIDSSQDTSRSDRTKAVAGRGR